VRNHASPKGGNPRLKKAGRVQELKNPKEMNMHSFNAQTSSSFPFRLAAIDLDDTLLGPDKQISAANAAAVSTLRDREVRIILASGRRHENMLRFHQGVAE